MRNIPNAGTRLASMFMDHIITCIILVVPVIPITAYFSTADGGNRGGAVAPWFQLLLLGLMCLYFFKDSFNGRSIAKRMLKLQVVDFRTGQPASVGQCFVRNLFIMMWPIEVLVTLFRPACRIGDLVAGTKVVVYDPRVITDEEPGLLSDLY